MSLRITGKLPSVEHLKVLKQSPNYRDGAFQNLSDTPMKAEDASYWKMAKDFFKGNKNASPAGPLPYVKTDLGKEQGEAPQITWFGHSSYLIRLYNKTILVDPVFSDNASPFTFMLKPFRGANEFKPDDMPYINYLVLTHDHYDHLDYRTIVALSNKIGKVFCSLGVSAHLAYWGIDKNIITELDWWQTAKVDDKITLTAAPARHFSGRGVKRGQTLWSSFILQTPGHNLYLGGDSGFDTHFDDIGRKYGPFDIAILECGQYNAMWPHIHMMPEQTAQAAIDLKTKMLMPVHWGKFVLAMHDWNEPVKRVLQESVKLGLSVTTPMIGEPVIIGEHCPSKEWWKIE